MFPNLPSDRFTTEGGYVVLFQVPADAAQTTCAHILSVHAMGYGDYDSVHFQTALGRQTFRALGQGRNVATKDIVHVDCVEGSFYCSLDRLEPVLRAIYHAHPYEEPVVYVLPALRTLHIRGMDEHNPNRFWNQKTPDWVPAEHRTSEDAAPT